MAMLPTPRSIGRNMTLVNPSREFEDIYDRVGQLMNMAVGSLGPVAVPDLPWAPAAWRRPTTPTWFAWSCPACIGTRSTCSFRTASWSSAARSPEPQQDEKERRHRSSRRTGRFEYRTLLPGDVNPDGVRVCLPCG